MRPIANIKKPQPSNLHIAMESKHDDDGGNVDGNVIEITAPLNLDACAKGASPTKERPSFKLDVGTASAAAEAKDASAAAHWWARRLWRKRLG